ncbi:MAG TPA: chromate transporter, partial [Spirochaetales bacterium]|nr:chromate transporter [Spirochaetales bacterium]
ATMTGFRVHGFLGAVVATLAVVAVPLILAIVVGMLAKKHFAAGSRLSEALKSATLGLLAMTVWAFAPSMASAWYVPVLSVLAFCLSMFTKLNPVWIILGAGCMGALVFTFL